MLWLSVALATGTSTGGSWSLDYGSCGTWESGTVEDPNAASTAYGTVELFDAWAQVTIEYEDLDGNAYFYGANDLATTCDWTVQSASYSGSSASHEFWAGDLRIARYEVPVEEWEATGGGGEVVDQGVAVLVLYEVLNEGVRTVSNVRIMVGVDVESDAVVLGTSETENDVEDNDGDGTKDWAISTSSADIAVGFAPCDPGDVALGFSSQIDDADGTFSDPNDTSSDQSLHIVYAPGALQAGEAVTMDFVLSIGTGGFLTRSHGVGAAVASTCEVCDEDADGYRAVGCGGFDCDDDDEDFGPGIAEVWYDGVDQDCDGRSDFDSDRDGFDSTAHGGLDCHDDVVEAFPGGVEVWYDGIDGDCDGLSDFDADKDGWDSDAHGGEDCNDEDPNIKPERPENWYDGVDQNCDGLSDYDKDLDGYDAEHQGGDDCDDDDDTIHPTAPEVDLDGIDQDCDTVDGGVDSDGDGVDDEDEVDLGTDWNEPDTDGDGRTDGEELEDGTDPTLADTDNDGLNDGEELAEGTDPLVADTDGDGLKDGAEVDIGTDPLDPDTDDDGLDDSTEVGLGTNPLHPDTDLDGYTDAEEVELGTDPLDADDPGTFGPDGAWIGGGLLSCSAAPGAGWALGLLGLLSVFWRR